MDDRITPLEKPKAPQPVLFVKPCGCKSEVPIRRLLNEFGDFVCSKHGRFTYSFETHEFEKADSSGRINDRNRERNLPSGRGMAY